MADSIFITNHDRKRLKELLTTQISSEEALGPHVRKLENEINKATIIHPDQADSKLITMNSVILLSLDGADMELSLVYPNEAEVSENKVSILSPSERLSWATAKATPSSGMFLPARLKS